MESSFQSLGALIENALEPFIVWLYAQTIPFSDVFISKKAVWQEGNRYMWPINKFKLITYWNWIKLNKK